MNKRETVQALLDSVQKGDFEHAKTMLADDFQFSGPTPEPIDQEAWVGMNTRLQTAFLALWASYDSRSLSARHNFAVTRLAV